MDTILTTIADALKLFFSFKAYVILPAFMLILALVARMRPADAILSTVRIGAGFAGVFIVFSFFVTQISPAIREIIRIRGIDFPVVDVGWPPLAAITWSTTLAPLVIVFVMLINMVILFTRTTKTLYIDLWNYWHFALVGALLQSIGAHWLLALSASILIAIYTIKTAEWSAPYVQRETGLEGVAISPISVSGFLPYAVTLNRLIDAVPVLRSLSWNPSKSRSESNGKTRTVDILQEPMIIGIIVGILLSMAAGYDLKTTLETAVNIAAVMFLLPRCGALIAEGMGAVAQAFKKLIEGRFTSLTGLSIAMDSGVIMTNYSVIATGLVMIPISLIIAFIIPGNRTIPLGDLPNLLSVMSVITLIMGGNVIRSIIAGIPIVASFMIFASKLAPLFTSQAKAAGMELGLAGQEITAFTDGGNQLRFWFFYLFQGNIIAIAVIPVVLAMLFFSWKTHRRISAEQGTA